MRRLEQSEARQRELVVQTERMRRKAGELKRTHYSGPSSSAGSHTGAWGGPGSLRSASGSVVSAASASPAAASSRANLADISPLPPPTPVPIAGLLASPISTDPASVAAGATSPQRNAADLY